MRKRPWLLGVAALAALALGVLMTGFRARGAAAGFETAVVDRGEISEIVGATGMLQAVTTVQVGSQVSGTIASLGADFNSVVKRGQVIARLDPSSFEARVAQMRSNLMSAQAQVERGAATIADARQKYERARELALQSLVPQSDLDSARAAHDGAAAQQKANEAAIRQAQAALQQAELDLAHSVIQAPIDGVVLGRNVDVGQTVAASFQAPVLFVIANDLSRMQVNAAIGEADIGRVRVGQTVTFRVDAYPDESFAGTVEQVRLQPVTSQNVVTYNTIINVANPGQKLMPGMTATVTIVSQNRPGVLRVPTAALRFRPEGAGEPGARRSPPAIGDNRRPTPTANRVGASSAPGRPGLVFVPGPDGRPAPRPVRLGISDGRRVEVLEGLEEGATVITGLLDGSQPSAPRPGASNNPFSPARPQPRTR